MEENGIHSVADVMTAKTQKHLSQFSCRKVRVGLQNLEGMETEKREMPDLKTRVKEMGKEVNCKEDNLQTGLPPQPTVSKKGAQGGGPKQRI